MKKFKFFKDFKLISDCRIIGAGNGSFGNLLNVELTQKNGHKRQIAMKLYNGKGPNLLYEYKVGLFLNRIGLRFPCFIETFHLHAFESENIAKEFAILFKEFAESKSKEFAGKEKLLSVLQHPRHVPKTQITNYCKEPNRLAITLQLLMNGKTLFEFYEIFYKNNNLQRFLETELFIVLFQVYGPLASLHDKYTHYDLHENNVMLATMPKMNFHYHYNQKWLSFSCNNVVKMIDYSFGYYYDTHQNNSTLFLSQVQPYMQISTAAYRDSKAYSATHDLQLALNIYNRIRHTKNHTMPEFLRPLRALFKANNNTYFCDKVINDGPIRSVKDYFNYLVDYGIEKGLLQSTESKNDYDYFKNRPPQDHGENDLRIFLDHPNKLMECSEVVNSEVTQSPFSVASESSNWTQEL